MATKWITLKGRVKFAQVYEPDDYMGDRRWRLNFYPLDEFNWERYRKSGLELKEKEDEDGKYIGLRRSCRKVFPSDDEATYFTGPEIRGQVQVKYVDENGEVVKSYKKSEGKKIITEGEQKAIGNGSLCLVNVAVYTTTKSNGHRLESITVLEHVEYNPEVKEAKDGNNANTNDAGVDVSNVPDAKVKKQKTEPKTKASEVQEDMNDEIPW